ncbi:MAG: hypothetical protein O7G88_22865 [bacterium]|nr:hypothetical protein [bacterium]
MQHSQEALTLAQEVPHPYSLAFTLLWEAVLHQCRRAVPATQEQAEAAITLVTEQGFAELLARVTILHGWALAMQGQVEQGIAEIRQLAAALATGAKTHQSGPPVAASRQTHDSPRSTRPGVWLVHRGI